MLDDALYQFHSYSTVHVGLLAFIALASWAAAARRTSLRGEPSRRRLDRAISLTGLAIWIISQTLEMIPSRFDVTQSLPIHICDVIGLIAPLAVLTNIRSLRAILYYWGLALSSQAIFQPELIFGIASVTFWVFWLPHGMIIGLAVYDLTARKFRPTRRDYTIATVTLAVYALLVLPVDLWLGVNYGFVGKISGPLDFLGAWPFRIFKAATAVIVVFAMMTWPWTFRTGRNIRRENEKGLPGEQPLKQVQQ